MKYKRNSKLLLCFIALLLYVFSPAKANSFFIISSFAVFIILAFPIIKTDIVNRNYFSFNIVFIFAFFLTSYCFPVFIMMSDLYEDFMNLSTRSIYHVNFDYITKATSLCTVAFSVYCLGCRLDPENNMSIDDLPCYRKKSNIFLIIGFLAVMANIILTVSGGTRDFNQRPFIYDIFPVLYAISLLANLKEIEVQRSIKQFIKIFWPQLVCSGIIMLTFLYFGERGNAITLGLITLAFYHFYYKKVGLFAMLAMAMVAVVILFSIRETRNKDDSLASGGVGAFASASSEAVHGVSPILLFSDLIGATQELCFGYETTKRDGLSYPSQIVLLPFYPIPKMPTILSKLLYDKEPGELFGGSILNDKMSSMSDSAFGSHIVIDIFMRWGILGVVLAFYLFGRIIARYSNKKYSKGAYATIFLLLMGMSLYIARSSITDVIRPIAYAFFFIYLLKKSYSSKQRQLCQK